MHMGSRTLGELRELTEFRNATLVLLHFYGGE